MNVIRILFAVCAISALVAAQTSTSPSTAPSSAPATRPRASAQTTASSTTTGSRVTLPSGTPIEVRVNETLSSETTQQGERFTGTVTSDVTDPNSNRVIIPRGAEVTGRVLSATPSGRLSSSGELQLSLSTIRYGNAVANVTVEPYVIKGESHTKSNATKVGGGAALGAIIGAIAGGGKGAAIGAGVGGAAGAGTAAATGKRPAEVQPEALVKFITSGDMSVTAADQSGYSNAPNASQSTTWPEPSHPASTSTTQSTTSASTPSTDTSADTTVNSDTPDAPPVMHRRDGSTAPTPSTSTDNSTGTAAARNTTSNTTTTASNSTYGTSNPPAANTGVFGTSNTTTTATTPTAPGTTTSTTTSTTSSLPDNRLFSARDRRVVNQCLKDNASSLPSAYMHKSTTAAAYQRNQTVPADIQRQLRSLPFACDNQLPAVSNDLERVIYGGQVMLIDSSSRILDVFDVTP